MSDVPTHAERLREWSQDELHLIQSARSHEPTYKNPAELRADVRALLEENATLRSERDQTDMERITRVVGERDRERLEAEALVVSLTEQRDEALGIREGHISAVQQVMRERATIVQLRKALGWAVDYLDVVVNDDEVPEGNKRIMAHTALVTARAALAAGVPSTPPDRPHDAFCVLATDHEGECSAHRQSEVLGDVGDARVEAGDGENFAARMQAARDALKGDEATQIAYLLNEPVEKVRAVMAWSSLVAPDRPDARVTAEEASHE